MQGRRFLFTGDLTWAVEGFKKIKEKRWLLTKMGVDSHPEIVRENILKVHDLMEKHKDLIVVPAHDADVHKALAQFPKWEE